MPVINLYVASIDANFDSTKGFFSDTLYFFGHPVFFRTCCIARKRKSAKFCSYGFHGQISKCHFCPWKLWHSKLEKSQTWSSYILYYKINQTRKNIWKNVYILHWLVTIPMPKDIYRTILSEKICPDLCHGLQGWGIFYISLLHTRHIGQTASS